MPPKKEPAEADILVNRANVALARRQELLSSWLPPKTPQELQNTKTEQELDREDAELFAPVNEIAGLGAPNANPEDAILSRRNPTSRDQLLEQMLGREGAKKHLVAKKSAKNESQDKRSKQQTVTAVEESDEEEGRASMISSRAKRKTSTRAKPVDNEQKHREHASTEPQDEQLVDANKATKAPQALDTKSSRSKKRSTNFLDEMLASRTKKRK